jgi:hypothetical protein
LRLAAAEGMVGTRFQRPESSLFMTTESDKINWPDLSPYGISLIIAKLPTEKKVLVLRNDPAAKVDPPAKDGENLVDRYARQAAGLGFERHKSGGVWVRHSTIVSAPAFTREFPKARLVRKTLDEVTLDMTKPREEKRGDLPAATVAKSRQIGLNRLGKEVWDGPDGRFIRDSRSNAVTMEAEVKPPSPGLFLRAPDVGSLAMCADGLIEEVATRGRIVREDEFLGFCATILDGKAERLERDDKRVPPITAAIEAAAARFLSKRGGVMRDAFNGSCRLYECLAFLTTMARSAKSSSVLPPPVAIVMQRVIGNDADLAGRSIMIPRAGVGQLLSHLPRGTDVRVRETDATLLPHLDANIQASSLRVAKIETESKKDALKPKDYDGCDIVMASYPRRLAEKPIKLDGGLVLSRADLGEAASMLTGRTDDGRAVIAFEGPSSGEEEAELARFQDWIGRRFQIEGAVDIDGSLHAGRTDAPTLRLISVGRRRPELLDQAPESAMTLREVRDLGALWTWTSEVVSQRMRLEAFFTAGADQALTEGDPDLQTNAFQAPYVSASQIGTPTTMVPRPLEGASREALSKVVRLHGSVDQWVAQQYGYDVDKLGEYFSPEQIDALALALHAEERNRGFLNADQTGLGKGRFLAGVMRRGVLRKRKVIFFTEKTINFSDIHRDIVHIGAKDDFKPMIVNSDAQIIDERDGKVVLRSAKKEAVQDMIRDRTWPTDVNSVFVTYSQINKAPCEREEGDREIWRTKAGDKSRWLLDVVDEDTVLVLDESHNAASGDSNISETLAHAVRQAGSVVYSSATFAKDAKSMAFYAPLLPEGMSADELAQILARGGETMQEVVSTMLVQDGVMVRREHDLSNIEFQTIPDSGRIERNRTNMDAFAPVLAEMASVAVEVDRHLATVNNLNANRVRREAEGDLAAQRDKMKGMQLSRTGFGSPLYTLSRLFVASLKIDATVDRALEALSKNEKPIILVENTIQSFLDELAEQEGDLEGAQFPEFKALVHRALTRLTSATRRNDRGETVRIDLTTNNATLRESVEKLRGMIERLPSMHASAIDVVKERINAAGFVCDEITGRGLEFTNGRVMRRPSVDKTRVKNAFNSGEIDALVINAAGCTGIDLHAGSRFADQRKRVMIELQELADILRQIQAYGRVNRYDQVVGPRIEAILSGLPIEIRNHAIRNSKLRRLSANVSSNRENAALIRDIPDIINVVGDTVCSRYADARPELMRRLGFEVDRNLKVEEANKALENPSTGLDSKRSANEFLARLIMLPVAMQEQVANELAAEYNATMEELEAKGETPLRTRDMAGVIHVVKTNIFLGAEVEHPDSVFQEPLYISDVAVVRKVDPMRKDAVIDAIQAGLTAASAARGEAIADHLSENRDSILESYLPDGIPTVRDGIAMNNRALLEQNRRLEKLATTLRQIRPGSEITFTSNDEDKPSRAIVTTVRHAPIGFEHVASLHAVEFVRPGDVQPHTMKFKTLMDDPLFKVDPGLEGSDYDSIMRRFDDAMVSKVDSARILTGNIFLGMKLAVEHGLGTLVTYERNDGTKHRGILVAKKFRNMDMLPVELTDPDIATAVFREEKADLRSSSDLGKGGISLTRLKTGGIQLELPSPQSRKYGFIHENPEIRELVKRSTTKDWPAKILLTEDEIRRKLAALFDAGVRLWCSGKHRTWATGYQNSATQTKTDLTAAVGTKGRAA